MRSVGLSFSFLFVGLAACGTVSLGDLPDDGGAGEDAAVGDAGGKVDATSTDGGPVTPIADGGPTGPTDATVDAADGSDASPGPGPGTDAATDASDAGDAGDSGPPDWVVEDAGTTDTLYTVGGSGPDDVYIGTDKGVYHSKGDGVWTLQPIRLPVVSVSAAAPGRIYTAGEFGLVDEGSGDGTWTYLTGCNKPTPHPPPTGPSGYGDVAAFGTTLYVTFVGAGDYGSGVCTVSNDQTDAGPRDVTFYDDPAVIDTVFTSDTGQAYIAGSDATGKPFIAARNGTSWTTLPVNPAGEVLPASAFIGGVAIGSSYWIVNSSEVWTGTATGAPTYYMGFGIERVFGIWSGAANDLWIVANGDHPEVVHVPGYNLPVTESLPQSPGILTAIWGSGGTDLYAVGENGAILHRKGP